MFPRDQNKKKNGTIESIIIWVTISECERNKDVFHLLMISLATDHIFIEILDAFRKGTENEILQKLMQMLSN